MESSTNARSIAQRTTLGLEPESDGSNTHDSIPGVPTIAAHGPGSQVRRYQDVGIAIGLLAATFGMSRCPEFFSAVGNAHQHLGAEYYNIARALVDGRGYSDPFGEATGSTAWMPPLYSFLLAGLLMVLGKKSLVAAAVVLITNCTLAGVGFAVYRMAANSKSRLSPLISLTFYLVWLTAFYYWFFQFTHDVWLLMGITTLLALQVSRYVETGEIRMWKWGLLGGVACGASPAIATAWAVLTLVGILRLRKHCRALCWSAAIAFAVATPWMIRNGLVFDQFIPVKSNYFFDAYQGNYADEDGLIDPRTTLSHPYQCYETRFNYGKLGESAFMTEVRAKYLNALKNNPQSLVTKSARRALTATLWYSPFLDMDTGLPLTLRRLVFALPFLGFLVAMGGRNRSLMVLLGLFYFAYLAPYVLTTLHIRYLLPLTPICILFAVMGLDRLTTALTARVAIRE